MNNLVEKGYIKELECGANFSYILEDDGTFSSTEYKVLQSQTDSCFVKCMRMLYNGKIQLYYLPKELKSFSSMLSSLDSESLIVIISNLFSDIIDVKNNGFLSCQNIDIAFKHIYIDPSTYKVFLVYLTLNQPVYDEYSSFENEIRTELVKLISGIAVLSSPKTLQLSADLSNGTYSIEDICAHIKGKATSCGGQSEQHRETVQTGHLRIVAMNAPMHVEIVVTKDDFVIGKKAELCDGVIDFNKMISRSHCKINKRGNQYIVTDLQSANGTYVNKVRLQPNQPFCIKDGDVIRLANSDFQVRID